MDPIPASSIKWIHSLLHSDSKLPSEKECLLKKKFLKKIKRKENKEEKRKEQIQ